MCGLKAAQIHERPFRAAKDHVQPLAALDSFLPNGKKDSDLTPFSRHYHRCRHASVEPVLYAGVARPLLVQ